MRRGGIFFLLVLLMGRAGLCCPFCAPTSNDLYSSVATSRAVARVEKMGSGKFRVLEVLKGEAKPGKVVLASQSLDYSRQNPVLLVSTVLDPNQPFWNESVLPLSTSEYEFVKKSLRAGSKSALYDIAVDNLEGSTPAIRESAYNILSEAPIEEVEKRASRVGQDKLIAWLKDPKVGKEQKSLFLLMATPGLKATDREWLHRLLFDPQPDAYAVHLPSLIIAYSEAGGPSAVAEIESAFLKPSTPASATFGPLSGLEHAGSFSRSASVRKAARAVFQREVQHPDRGVFAISRLGQWRDFGPAARVEELAYKNTNATWILSTVVRYFRSFKSEEATAALRRLQARFPGVVESTLKPFPRS